MAYTVRTAKRSLIERLQEEPYRFSLDQALYICKRYISSFNAKNIQEKAQYNHQDSLKEIRLCGKLHFDLQAYEVVDVQFLKPDQHTSFQKRPSMTITTNRMNLLGVQSPLPVAYRELLVSEKRQKHLALEAFLNVFNHRILEISHRISLKRFPALQGAPFQASLLGTLHRTFTGILPGRSVFSEQIGFSGHLWEYPRSLSKLERQLQNFFNTRTKACNFLGGWRPIDAIDHTILGCSAHLLGVSTLLGKRIWDQAHGLILMCFPETFEDFCAFLPKASRWSALAQYMRSFLGAEHSCTMFLHPPMHTSGTYLNGKNLLGHTSWLTSFHHSSIPLDPVRLTVC
ncbi:MAG: type VI secretion system baseplate subunit TssG [Holosporales bacterium]|nr:type VI secretion system baseplate subunit TssG [Holosporales bacterium]